MRRPLASSSEAIAARHDIGRHSKRIDFLEHAKHGLRLGIDNPNTLEDLAQQTDVYTNLEPISKGHSSKLTRRQPFQAVAELATAVLEHPSLYHPAGVARKRLEQLRERHIVGCDATRLPLRTTLVVDTGDRVLGTQAGEARLREVVTEGGFTHAGRPRHRSTSYLKPDRDDDNTDQVH